MEIGFDSNGCKTLLTSNAKEGILMAANPPADLILPDLGKSFTRQIPDEKAATDFKCCF